MILMPGTMCTRQGGGPSAWTPAQLGSSTELWLDANDASTVTTVGSVVSVLADKSSYGRDCTQSTGASRPTYDSVNGALDFPDQTGKHMDGTWPKAVIEADLVLVYYLDWTGLGAHGGYNTMFQFATNDNDFNFWQYNNSSAKRVQTFVNGGIGANTAAQSYAAAPGKVIFSVTKVGNDHEIFDDGVSVGTGTRALGTLTGNQVYRLMDGTLSTATNPIGKFYEMVVASDTTERQRLEGYMAWKYGLSANLPIGHPYKDAAP